MSLYEACIPQSRKMLSNLGRWLDKGVEHAKTKHFDPNVLLAARLAPDQHSLVHQVQAACDQAKFAAARLTGKQAPSHPDTEQTMEQIQERIRTVVAHLESYTPDDFAQAADFKVVLPFLEGKSLLGRDFWNEMASPNFYFHLVTAYAILRHNGVDLGKRDFIGSLRLEG
jgi:uncharacterized protein